MRRSFSEVTQDLLEEALRMRQCPGIYFADEPAGREAKIGGTGLGVWEVIRDYLNAGKDEKVLKECFPAVSEAQLKAGLLYYRKYPREIADQIAENEAAFRELVETEQERLDHSA
jgi:uncharacterized protein (DUF433 family)